MITRKELLHKITTAEFCAHINSTPQKKTKKKVSQGRVYEKTHLKVNR